MKYSTDPIFEAYSNHRKQFILEQSVADFYSSDPLKQIHDLYKYDLECIQELVTEGMLGDAFSKVKGGIGKAASYVANKGIQLLFSLIKKTATPEDLKGIEDLKDPEKLKELAKKGMATLNKEASSEEPATNNEAVYLNKLFFASSVLTESNIQRMLERYSFVNEQILTEAKVVSGYSKKYAEGLPETIEKRSNPHKAIVKRKRRENAETLNKKQEEERQKKSNQSTKGKKAESKEKPMSIAKYAKQVADELKKKYSDKQIAKFSETLSKKLGGKDQVSQRAPITSLGKRPKTDVLKGDEGSLVPVSSGKERVSPQLGYGGSSNLTRIEPKSDDIQVEPISSTTSDIKSKELPYTGVSAPATKNKEGIIRKAINWVKANPKRTAGTLLGIIAAIGVAVGGPAVLIPMLTKAGLFGGGTLGTAATGAASGALFGAGTSAAKNIASQGFSNKKFSGKELGKSVLKGAGKGAAAGAIGGVIKGMFDDHTSDSVGNAQPLKPSDTGDTEAGGDSDYTGGTGDVSATSADFQKYNGEPLDPKSWRDKIKMSALDKFKREGGGEIDASKYNNFVKKLVAMGKGAKGKSIESIMGESYTVHYLSLLR